MSGNLLDMCLVVKFCRDCADVPSYHVTDLITRSSLAPICVYGKLAYVIRQKDVLETTGLHLHADMELPAVSSIAMCRKI